MSLIEKTTEIGNSIIALIDAKTGGAPDGKTVKSTDGVMSAIGVKESNKDKAIKTWVGTLAEYEALESVDENTLYNITDDVEGEEVFNTTKVNLDGSNYEGSGLQTVVDSNLNSKMTNCITEIPQRIKLEWTDKVSGTLKAGSVVIVPFGLEDLTEQYPEGATFQKENFKVHSTQFNDGKFFVWAEVQNDMEFSLTSASSSLYSVFTTDSTTIFGNVNSFSGDTAPTFTGAATWYDTANNIMKRSADSGATWISDGISLPISKNIVEPDGSRILKVFNGMGYIGKTWWVDKGVKAIMPNGRNEDGSLRNIYHTQPNLAIRTDGASNSSRAYIFLQKTGVVSAYNKAISTGIRKFDEQNNYWDIGGINSKATLVKIGEVSLADDKYYNVKFTTPVKVFTSNDTDDLAGLGMPSNKYLDLTLGASGSAYRAPANGWVFFSAQMQNAGDRIFANNDGIGDIHIAGYLVICSRENQVLSVTLPVKKGDTFKIGYNTYAGTPLFRFTYAQGEIYPQPLN